MQRKEGKVKRGGERKCEWKGKEGRKRLREGESEGAREGGRGKKRGKAGCRNNPFSPLRSPFIDFPSLSTNVPSPFLLSLLLTFPPLPFLPHFRSSPYQMYCISPFLLLPFSLPLPNPPPPSSPPPWVPSKNSERPAEVVKALQGNFFFREYSTRKKISLSDYLMGWHLVHVNFKQGLFIQKKMGICKGLTESIII